MSIQEMSTLILGLIGFLLTAYGIKQFIRIIRIQRNGVKVTGRIVEVIETESSDNDLIRNPVIEYITATGEIFRTTSAFNYSKPIIGQPVRIIYNSLKPEEIVEDTLFHKYFISAFLLVMGLSFIACLL